MGLNEFITPSVTGSGPLTVETLEAALADCYATIAAQPANTLLIGRETWAILKRVRHDYVVFHGAHRIGKRVLHFKRARSGQKVVLA